MSRQLLKNPSLDSPFDTPPQASPMRMQKFSDMRRTRSSGKTGVNDVDGDGEKKMSQAEKLLAKVRASSGSDLKKQATAL